MVKKDKKIASSDNNGSIVEQLRELKRNLFLKRVSSKSTEKGDKTVKGFNEVSVLKKKIARLKNLENNKVIKK